MLIIQGGRFHGVLEGPQRVLFNRMEAIVTDSRHRNLVVVREDAVTQRRFQNWSFGSLPDSVPSGAGEASVGISEESHRPHVTGARCS